MDRTQLAEWAALILAFVLIFVSATCEGRAEAETGKRALSLAVAKVSANEGALWNVADVRLIWQATEAASSTDAGRLAWLRSHSGRVLDRKPCASSRNCRWTRNLSRGGTMPAGLAAGRGYWRHKIKPRWEAVLAEAERCVSDGCPEPCHIEPTTWGGPMDIATAFSERRLIPLNCRGTLNDGFRPLPAVRW